MTFNGWLQIVLFAVLVFLLTKPFGGYMTRVFTGERTLLRPLLRPIEVGIYRICGVREESGAALGGLCRRDVGLQLRWLRDHVWHSAVAERAAAQSAGTGRNLTRFRLQYRGQLHDQHQLAVVCPRDDDELSYADDCADGAQLPLGSHRYRPRDRAGACGSLAVRHKR